MAHRQKLWDSFLQQKSGVPPRLRLSPLIMDLYQDGTEWSRQALLTIITELPLMWGPWKGIKQIFKQAEASDDFEMLGAIAVRCDIQLANQYAPQTDVTDLTFGYLRRRGWRYLRHLATSMPDLYPYAVVQFLRWYPSQKDNWYANQTWNKTWIANHIFFHNHKKRGGEKQYGSSSFKYGGYYNKAPDSLCKHRAFPELWNESPEPLLDLLLLCRDEHIGQFAVELLQEQFASDLRDLPLPYMIRLGQRPIASIQRFVQEWIQDNPEFQKAQFKELGLHDLMLKHFLFSDEEKVRKYAIKYAQDYAKDMSFDLLKQLFRSDHSDLNKFGSQLLSDKDPRDDIGLENLQVLLRIPNALDIAKKKLESGFRPTEIPLDWFKPLLFDDSWNLPEYAVSYLKKQYPTKQIPTEWLQDLLQDPGMEGSYYSYMAREFAMSLLSKRAKQLDTEWIQLALLHSNYTWEIWSLITEGKITTTQLDLDWLKAAVSPAHWDKNPWVMKHQQQGHPWVDSFSFNYSLQDSVLRFLTGGEAYKPEDLGLDWLLSLLGEEETDLSQSIVSYMMEQFHPVDFASDDEPEVPAPAAPAVSEPAESPFEGKTVLFTGKLSSLTRSDAQARLKEVGGKAAKSVTKDLDFLVVGDDGSPLFTGGKKGSKLTKAEKLQAEGAALEIISETAWLGMMAEGSAATVEVDTNAVHSGYRRLLRWAKDGEQAQQVQSFAISYLRHRHPLLGSQLTGRPLKGHAIIPRDLFLANDFLPLLADESADLQKLAVSIARFELRRWQVPPSQIFALCESPFRQVRAFAIEALMGPEEGETAEPYHFRPEELDPNLVFALCESRRKAVRYAGVSLLQKHYDLLDGDKQVLRLAESPDRDVRTRAIQILWQRYRRPSISAAWQPKLDKRNPITPRASMDTLQDTSLLLQFARMVLFGLPPGKLEKQPKGASKLWSNSKAKVQMVHVLKDLALESRDFAEELTPLLQQFLSSHHKMEAMGSLTALAQIEQKWTLQG
ncbi:MAG: hypothetical protein EP343_10320 [Deltaproteobacteria bacterium]|nr:MAG: hypothetical protein EP343_10320 [Deltaproteobacteria bacterium]